jgi:hypothetical protein
MKDVNIGVEDELLCIRLARCNILVTPEAVKDGVEGNPLITLIHVVPTPGQKTKTRHGPWGALVEVEEA